MDLSTTSCAVCQSPAKQSCSSCHAASYCSKECQKQDWKNHKERCLPYVIKVHPVYGRHLVASRDLAAGDIIMKEHPIAIGPKRSLSQSLCLGCHRRLTEEIHQCYGCNFSLCSESCAKSQYHEAECQILSKGRDISVIYNYNKHKTSYDCILPLRCLLLKYSDPKKWKLLNTMQDSVDQLNEGNQLVIKTNIIGFFKSFMKSTSINENEIYKICGILNTNSFETSHNGSSIEGVYPKVALMAHNCIPNTENVFNSLQIVVRVTRPIRKGENITTTYAKLICNTLKRRDFLKKAKFFDCDCLRCGDPTEGGSNLGTIKCNQCKDGFIMSTSPYDNLADWICQQCGHCMTANNVENINKKLSDSFLTRDRYVLQNLDDFMDQCHQILHPNHQIISEAKLAWVNFVGNHPDYRYKDISKNLLLKKVSYCRDLLELSNVIFPGKTQYRGYFLYELHAALFALAKKEEEAFEGNFTVKNVQDLMNEAKRCLEETTNIFYLEEEMENRGLKKKLLLLQKEFGTLSL